MRLNSLYQFCLYNKLLPYSNGKGMYMQKDRSKDVFRNRTHTIYDFSHHTDDVLRLLRYRAKRYSIRSFCRKHYARTLLSEYAEPEMGDLYKLSDTSGYIRAEYTGDKVLELVEKEIEHDYYHYHIGDHGVNFEEYKRSILDDIKNNSLDLYGYRVIHHYYR